MNKRAFTLIEVLGAILILGIGIVPVVGLIQTTLITSQKQEWETNTLYFAKQKIEEEIQLLRENFFQNPLKTGVISGNYRFIVQQTQDGIQPFNYLRIVAVTVWYDENENGGTPESSETKTILNTKIARR